MLAKGFITRLLGFVALSVGLPTLAASNVVAREFSSRTLNRNWSYSVYLPDNYDSAKLRYPVMYLLHGNNQKGSDWITLGHIQTTADALINKGEIPATIIVMPDAGTTWYVDRKEKMETAIIHDLIPEIENHFATIATRDSRVIAGLSMGAYGALRFAFKYPELFKAAALLSPAIYETDPPENSSARRVGVFGDPSYDPEVWKSLSYPALWNAYLQKQTPVRMYIVSGDDDEFFIEAEATKFYSLLRKQQQPAELRIVNGNHSWPVWADTIGDAMRYIYSVLPSPIK